MGTKDRSDIDELDKEILRILKQNPRMAYAEMAQRLEAAGYELSSEGVRQRVSNLFDNSKIFLLSSPENHSWVVLRVYVTVDGGTERVQAVYERMADLEFWMLCQGMGTIDIQATATAESASQAKSLYDAVREIDGVEDADFLLETGRDWEISKYL
jgi:DNA-binding Lrp family transcriptional regulator